ncbi:MAG: polyribonucleotide nucleotidyltransferase [Candidatus Spechtbacteria bacterium RIFCSPHIGHO2_02_FULL_43_15b]|nr:MAG: polyribonucleotide nucleotidyltransferase [Candidatus Spechtbacteria bacterium RIFCSPHIGHO2_02_FULL_43_15b]
MEKPKTYSLEWGGRDLKVTLNNWAEQTNGSALVQYGDTVVLATSVMSKNPKEGTNFFPLLVDYQEKYYASGKIKKSRFIKREGRPSDDSILTGRMIDRALRPNFDMRMRNDIQVIVTTLSYDNVNDPAIPGFIAASISLAISDIPWNGPLGAVRVGKLNGKLILNPTIEDEQNGELLLTIAGTKDKINMIEASAKEIAEEQLAEGFEFGLKFIQKVLTFQDSIIKENAKPKKQVPLYEIDEALKVEITEFLDNRLEDALFRESKIERNDMVNDLKDELKYFLEGKYGEKDRQKIQAGVDFFEERVDKIIHKNILEKNRRVDGRDLDQLREISCEVALLPRTHGSGFFARGNTHALVTVTLGPPGVEQIIDEMKQEEKKGFMLHYNFPGFSVGEIMPMRSPGRREIGHGALAEKALASIIPTKEDFPYTIRIVSEILSSNGSSSMASVSGGTLAMMDAGIPIKSPVAGIAMGLMTDNAGKYKVLTDIQGPEDHHGDMDFKVAGTKNGVTAIQMDVKIDGVTIEILKNTLEQAKRARHEILEKMLEVIEEPRQSLSPYAPRIMSIIIDPSKIGEVIGPGGKIINQIIDETGVLSIDIDDDGKIFIAADSGKEDAALKALAWIKNITREIRIGETFDAKVVKIAEFGAFVELTPKHDGLVHISELSDKYVKSVEDIVKIGDTIKVKVIKIDDSGKIGLSAKNVK